VGCKPPGPAVFYSKQQQICWTVIGSGTAHCVPCRVLAVHPGVTDSSWYKKADNEAYTFSWIISRVRAVAPFIGVGQPTRSGAISSIYVSGHTEGCCSRLLVAVMA
jgi:hypothetical protein